MGTTHHSVLWCFLMSHLWPNEPLVATAGGAQVRDGNRFLLRCLIFPLNSLKASETNK